MELNCKTTFEAWKKSLKSIIDYGEDFKDRDGRVCREVLNMVVNIESPEQDFEKPMEYMKEFELIYPSREELSGIMFNKDDSTVYDYSYGPRIFNFIHKKDQVNDFIIPLLKREPLSRRAVISLYNPATDSSVLNKNIPSLMFISFKIKNGKLNLSCFIRSNDYFIGWPGNIYQILLLQKYVADKLSLQTGQLTTTSCSAHIFHEHLEMINKIIKKE